MQTIDVNRLDADVYYNTADGAARVDSSKHSIGGMAEILQKGTRSDQSQAQRQAEWVAKGTPEEPRRMGFFVLDKTSGFRHLMNDKNFKQLENIIPESDRGTRNIIIGDRKYSLNDLNELNKDLQASARRAAEQNPEKFKTSQGYKDYYKSLGDSPNQLMRSAGKTYGEPAASTTATEKAKAGTLQGRAAGGAVVGAATGATLSVIRLADDGQLNVQHLGEVAQGAAQGAGVGVATAVVERVAGGTTAGAVVAGAVSAWDNREGLAHGDSKAIGNVAADATVGAVSVVAATEAGAAIGSFVPVPVVGTVRGAAVGFGVGMGVNYLAQHSGVRNQISKGVAAGVDELKHLF